MLQLSKNFRIFKRFWKVSKGISCIICFIILILIVLAVFWRKDIWFCDEVYTYQSANAKSENLFSDDIWMTGSDVVSFFSANDLSFNFKEIAERLYKDHVPLYFWLFRCASLIGMGSISKWIGLGLNLVFLTLLYYGLVQLIRIISGCSYLQSAITALLCLVHPLFLSEISTIRMYLMLTLIQVLFVLEILRNKKCLKGYIKIGLLSLIGLLTHYYFWIWGGLLSVLYVLFLLLRERNLKGALYYTVTMVGSLCLASIIFPQWFSNIFLNPQTKGYSSYSSLFSNWSVGDFVKAVKSTISMLAFSMDPVAILVLFFAAFALYIYLIRDSRQHIVVICTLSSMLYAVIVTHSQPSVENRYIWSSSLLFLIVFYCCLITGIDCLLKRANFLPMLKNTITIAILTCNIGLHLYASFSDDFYKLSQYVRYRSIEDREAILHQADIPWLVFYDDENWTFYCSMFDFSIPKHIKKVSSSATEKPDIVLNNASDIIIYTDEKKKNIDSCIDYIENCSEKHVTGCIKILKSYALTVYKVHLSSKNIGNPDEHTIKEKNYKYDGVEVKNNL